MHLQYVSCNIAYYLEISLISNINKNCRQNCSMATFQKHIFFYLNINSLKPNKPPTHKLSNYKRLTGNALNILLKKRRYKEKPHTHTNILRIVQNQIYKQNRLYYTSSSVIAICIWFTLLLNTIFAARQSIAPIYTCKLCVMSVFNLLSYYSCLVTQTHTQYKS